MTIELADLARKIDQDVKRQAHLQSGLQWIGQCLETYGSNISIEATCTHAGGVGGYMQAMALIEEALKARLPQIMAEVLQECPAELEEIRSRYQDLLAAEAAR